MPLKRAAWLVGAVLVVTALAATSVARHRHGHDAQTAGHADCDVCHFRHLPLIETDSTPAQPVPDLVADVVPPVRSQDERGAARGTRPTRGPPA